MSVFANLFGGLADGAGKWMVAEARDDEARAERMRQEQERRDREVQLQQMRDQERSELQRQRAQDRMEQMAFQASSRTGAGGGRGGSDGVDVFSRLLDSDPQQSDRIIRTMGAFGLGVDGEQMLRERLGMNPAQERVTPTAGDFARFDRTLDESGQSESPVPQAYVQRAQYDAERGAQSIQRLYTLLRDPAKLDSFAKAGTEFMRQDIGAEVVRNEVRNGNGLEEGATKFNQITNPGKFNEASNDLAADRLDLKRQEEERKREKEASEQDIRLLGMAERAVVTTQRAMKDASKSERAALKSQLDQEIAARDELRGRISARKSAQASQASAPNPSRAPGSPASRAQAFKAQFN